MTIVVVLMTIIAIVEEAFFEAQDQKSITNSTTKMNTDSHHGDDDGDDHDHDHSTEDRDGSSQPSQGSRQLRQRTPFQMPVRSSGQSQRTTLSSQPNDDLHPSPEEPSSPIPGMTSNSTNNSFSVHTGTGSSMNMNSSNLMGKRDLPDHLRFLLQNVDKIPSSSSKSNVGTPHVKSTAQASVDPANTNIVI